MTSAATHSIPLICPHCAHDDAKLAVRSQTILTVTCAKCAYTWAVELANVPEPVRAAAQLAALERGRRQGEQGAVRPLP